jgi:hypothetical protein
MSLHIRMRNRPTFISVFFRQAGGIQRPTLLPDRNLVIFRQSGGTLMAYVGLLWLLVLMGVVVWGQARRKDIGAMQPSFKNLPMANVRRKDHRQHWAVEDQKCQDVEARQRSQRK